jgi:concanavalin A-like lectin/glucanase superfamily protein
MKQMRKMNKALLAGGMLPFLLTFVGDAVAQTCVQPPPNLVSWWTSDGNANDIQDGNNGTLQNGATFAAGLVGQAFSFDGVSALVSVPDSPSLSFGASSSITVDLWAFRTATNPVMHLVGKRDGCGALNYQMALNTVSGEGLVFGAGFGDEVATGTDLPLNTWTFLAGTFDGTNYRFYINGLLATTTAGTLGPINTAPLEIGGSGTCTTFAGLIDEVEIFNRPLSGQEIQAIFNAGSAGKCKVTTVAIDIKPQSCPNPINVGAQGVLPVAILGTATFDVTTVDPSSVKLQGVSPLRSALEDVATPFTGALVNATSCTTAGPEGFTDLVLLFDDQAVSAALGPVTNGQVLILTLTGNLLPQFGGGAISGQDIVIVIK